MRLVVTVAIILFVALLSGCSGGDREVTSKDDAVCKHPYIAGGFADVSSDGQYGLIVGAMMVGEVARPVMQIVRVSDFETFEYSVIQTIEGETSGAHFCGLGQVAFVRSDGDSVRLMTCDIGGAGYEETLLSCLPVDSRFPLSEEFRLNVGVPAVCLASGSRQMVYRFQSDGTLAPLRTLEAAAFPSFANGSDELLFFVNRYEKDGQSRIWDARLVAYNYAEDTVDTLFGAQSCFGTVVVPEGEDVVYFQSSMPEFDATNVWKYDRADGKLTQVTAVAPPEFVSNFHVVGDSIAALVKDPSHDSDRQYRYVMHSR